LKHITRPVARSPSTLICTFAFECCVFGNIGIAFLRNAIVWSRSPTEPPNTL
jgi:hypothetical protein